MAARNVLLVYPRFTPGSFWNYRTTCEVIGKRCPAAPLGLITVAALLPADWRLRLVDRNAEELAPSDLDGADLVMTGGMMSQQRDTLDLIALCRAHGAPVAVGGPDATSSPHLYQDADFVVTGEAEGIIGEFVAAVERGQRSGFFAAEKYTVDVGHSPIPRFDLLNFDHYLQIGVQFSRGCPFTCEFCDIIELYGRVPRTKSADQMLAELEVLYRLGWRGHVDFVDDNLIGNKKAIKAFLPLLATWLAGKDYPFEFSTEASVNLADDDELLRLMRAANFFVVFCGIESADAETLAATRKRQNTRRDLADSIHRIHAAGMFVMGGFIVGFDTEKPGAVAATADLIERAALPVCMVGLLSALPNTQLARRLQREGRLHRNFEVMVSGEGDHCSVGLNFDTVRPRPDILRDCAWLIRELYRPERFFGRVRRLLRWLDCRGHRIGNPFPNDMYSLARLVWWAMVIRADMRREVWKTVAVCLVRNPTALHSVLRMIALYLHFGPFARYAADGLDAHIAAGASPWQRHHAAARALPDGVAAPASAHAVPAVRP
ncbi:MAG: B12-binding domain-containing radical SAM protein [Alphaproteobacteria bacterium]|nr:B12-binding domain-containing radical SAM protein [Alphaproteobacteria bacterium]